jgi:DNA-binding response OmpR family regulator
VNILNIQGDEPTMRVMTWILEEAGHQVFNASGPHEATRYIIPDLIVINTNMPVHEKRACVQALRMLVPSVRIIDLAIDASEVAHDTGADAYLDKPFSAESLLEQVRFAFQDGHAR